MLEGLYPPQMSPIGLKEALFVAVLARIFRVKASFADVLICLITRMRRRRERATQNTAFNVNSPNLAMSSTKAQQQFEAMLRKGELQEHQLLQIGSHFDGANSIEDAMDFEMLQENLKK
ncbi:hypothetical protein HJFPF1_04058 [Paramyrothecium foliicola]|nr:hypothetical protein HJFPF1_04058 [Paramyrothecium foliicola]